MFRKIAAAIRHAERFEKSDGCYGNLCVTLRYAGLLVCWFVCITFCNTAQQHLNNITMSNARLVKTPPPEWSELAGGYVETGLVDHMSL